MRSKYGCSPDPRVVFACMAVLLLLSSLNSLALESETLVTLSLSFERKVVQGDSTEIVKGMAYYQDPGKVFIDVKDPVSQIMVILGNVMHIYYPAEQKAFRIIARGPIPMPLVQAILSTMKDDYGLTEMGYTLGKHESKGNVLYTYWNPPRKLKKHLGQFILGTTDDRVVYAEARDPKGKTTAKSFYRKHMELAGKFFPLEVHSDFYGGPEHVEEYVLYSDVELNVPLPEAIVNFKIPDSIPVEEVEW